MIVMRSKINQKRGRRRAVSKTLRRVRTMINKEGFHRFFCTARQEGGTIFLDFTNTIAGGRKTFGTHVDSFLWAICSQFGLGCQRRGESENSVTFALRRGESS